MHPALDVVSHQLRLPVLHENPFPEAISYGCGEALKRLEEWSTHQRSKIESDLARFRRRAEPPEDWEVAALRTALREWRVFESFRRLHEQHWCPSLFFRLRTKTDLHVLCGRDADSSTGGYTDRQRKVLAKRGIDDRFKWREARQMVRAMGLLEPLAETGDADGVGTIRSERGATLGMDAQDARESTDGLSAGADAAVSPGEAREDDGPEAAAGGAYDAPSRKVGDEPTFPPLRLDRVWASLPTYTKAQLEAVYQRMAAGPWGQFADRFYSSFKKPEMLAYVQRLVRFHANLEAVQHLTPAQLDALFDWMRVRLGDRCQRDEDLRIAARLFADFKALADVDSLSPEAWNRYRDAEIRRMGAYCYHLFLEHETGK